VFSNSLWRPDAIQVMGSPLTCHFKKKAKKIMTKTPSSKIYSKEYFLSDCCDGYKEFLNNKSLSYIKKKQLKLLNPKEGDRILDIGCGRSEVLYHCAKNGAIVFGIDYSKDALEISRETLRGEKRAYLCCSCASPMPFKAEKFDKILIGDVIEHLTPEETENCITELSRILKKGGFVLIHTSPNAYFKKFIFPTLKFFFALIGKSNLLKEIHTHILMDKVHINEYSPFRFKRLVKSSGLKFNVWLDKDLLREGESRFTQELAKSPFIKLVSRILALKPFIYIFSNDLWAKGIKE